MSKPLLPLLTRKVRRVVNSQAQRDPVVFTRNVMTKMREESPELFKTLSRELRHQKHSREDDRPAAYNFAILYQLLRSQALYDYQDED